MAFLDFLDPRRKQLAGLEGALTPPFNADAPDIPTRLPPLSDPNAVTPPFALPGPAPMPSRPDMTGASTAMRAPSSSLPDTTATPNLPPRPALGPSMAGPGPAIEYAPPPTQYERLQAEKEGYMRGAPGRGKGALLGVLSGALQGLGSGGGLGGAVGGALAGGIYGGADPRGLRERSFETREKPKILERFAYEDAERARQAAQAKAALDAATTQAQIANINSQIEDRANTAALANRKQTFDENKPTVLAPGASIVPRGANRPSFTAAERAKQPATSDRRAQAMADLVAEKGTVEEVSQGSLQGRIESLKGRLTPEEQRLVVQPTQNDDPQAVARAQQKWQRVQSDELNSIRRNTQQLFDAEVTRRLGGQSAQQGRSAQSGAAKPLRGQPGRRAISVDEAADLLK